MNRHPYAIVTAAIGLLLVMTPAPAHAAVLTGCDATQHGVDQNGKPFGRVIDKKGNPIGTVDAKQPVLLIHGVNGDGVTTWNGTNGPAAQMEADGGYFVGRFDYGNHNQDWVVQKPGTPSIAGQLANAIHCLAQQSRQAGGSGKVILVGYSMGGLAAQAAASQAVDGRPVASDIGGLISIGTPWKGVDHTAAQFLSALNWAICNRTMSQAKRHHKKIPTDTCKLVGTADSEAGKAITNNANGDLPKIPSGFPVFPIAGSATWNVNLLGHPFQYGGGDGVASTESATHPPVANSNAAAQKPGSVDCTVPAAQLPSQRLVGWNLAPTDVPPIAELRVSLIMAAPGCGHFSMSNSPDVAKILIPELRGWRDALQGGVIAGTHTLYKTLANCAGTSGGQCFTTPMIIRVNCSGGNCTATRLDTPGGTGWHYRHPISFDGTSWKIAGQDDHPVTCNGSSTRPISNITFELKMITGAIVKGEWKPSHLEGTYMANATTPCPNSTNLSQGSWLISSIKPG